VALIDLDRLAVYEQILSIPDDSSVKDRMNHRRTQSGKSSRTSITDLKSKFVRYLMHRQLDRDGDL